MLVTAISLLACTLGASGEAPTTIGTAPNPGNQSIMFKGKPVHPLVDVILRAPGTATLPDGSAGLVRFTSQVHTWSQAVAAPASEQAAPLTMLLMDIGTGEDDLRAGSTADVVVHFATAADVTYKNVNQSQQWNAADDHQVLLMPLPDSAVVGDVQSVSIVTNFAGGVAGDNWDVRGVELIVGYLA